MAEADGPARIDQLIQRLERIRAAGDGFATFDAYLKALRRNPKSLVLAYQAVLQAARIGALTEAQRLYDQYKIETRIADGEVDPAVPFEDLLALSARLTKDRALEAAEPHRTRLLAEAAYAYITVYQRTGGHYPLINSATVYALAGDSEKARLYATWTASLLERLAPANQPDEELWRRLSALEAYLNLGDLDRAREAATAAASVFEGDYGNLSTTVGQLNRLVKLNGLNFDVATALRMPSVLHYAGHVIAPPGEDGRFPASREREVAVAIARFLQNTKIGWGYGSLAAGADILIVEGLQRCGAQVHIVLPFAEAEFVEISVRPSGADWIPRFERCLRRAKSVRTVIEGSYFKNDSLFGACSAYAIGLARLQSRQLGTSLRQLLVWDGEQNATAAAGTAVDYRLGRSLDLALDVIPLPRRYSTATQPAAEPANSVRTDRSPTTRHARAMVFCDVKGFSRIDDDDLPNFNSGILTSMAHAIAELPRSPAIVETWGDAVFLVYPEVDDAAAAAVTLCDVVHAAKASVPDLPRDLDLRVSAHYGSTFDVINPFTGRAGCFGIHVSRAARIEPVTPPGVVYVSEAFAAQLALKPASTFRTDFVGTTKLAKKFGNLPVFRLINAHSTAA